ncbi:MAG: addiction module protein, partial [Nitrospirota bacterium]
LYLDNRETSEQIICRIYKKGDKIMGTISSELAEKIKSLPDTDKIELVDSILAQLDKPDPEIDRIWAHEARKRWQAYKAGKLETVPYEQVMEKYRAK